MRQFGRVFLRGLGAIVPVVITVYIVAWLATGAERLLGGVFQWLMPEGWYFPGLGLLAGVGLVYAVGIIVRAYLVQRLTRFLERLVQKIPMVKIVYGAAKDLMQFLTAARSSDFNQVVTVEVGPDRYRLMGLITREDFSEVPAGVGNSGEIAVYLPMSYQIGGYTVILPRERVTPVDMPVDQALRFTLTAGMSLDRTESR